MPYVLDTNSVWPDTGISTRGAAPSPETATMYAYNFSYSASDGTWKDAPDFDTLGDARSHAIALITSGEAKRRPIAIYRDDLDNLAATEPVFTVRPDNASA
jgi:hypothetical protein